MPIFYKARQGDGTLTADNRVEYTDEMRAVASNQAALNYINENDDVRQGAVAKTLARGITPDSPEYGVTLANYGKEHWRRF